jgi:hypothetical protein
MIEQHMAVDPRTLQKTIGPSGIGTDCYHCLGCMIAQEPKLESNEDRWLTYIGKAVHEQLAKAAEYDNQVRGRPRWLVEERVRPGLILDDPLEGNADAYDLDEDRVIDWKVVGDNTLNKVSHGYVSPTYLKQIDTYGLGFEEAGYPVKDTTIMFLPRNRFRLREGIPVHRPYNRQNALNALRRANDIALLGKEHGWDHVLPRLKRDPQCYDCPRYAR